MYLSHFRLERDPFSLTPDPRFLFLSEQHREAFAHLLYGLGEKGGFVQLTGEVGTGKTTLCRSLLDQVPEGVDVALLLNPRLTALELVSTVCDDLGIPYPAGTQSLKVLVDFLNDHLLRTHAAGRRTVLVLDEAQQLSADVLEQVRLLTNLETATAKLLKIVLIGQPELQVLMARPELRQLSQRVTARYHLAPLSAEETAAYVRHRLEVAGCKEPIFTRAALRRVHRLSGGIPRLVNVICDRALLGAWARNRRKVVPGLVSLAASEVTGRRLPLPVGRWLGWGGAVVAGALAVAVATRLPWPAPWVQPGEARPTSAAATAPQPEESLSELLAGGAGARDRKEALAALLGLWGVPSNGASSTVLRERAAAAGLKYVEGQGDWASFARFNRPAALELSAAGRTSQAVVTGLAGDRVTLALDGRVGTYLRTDAERLWTGRYALLWKPPPVASPLLAVGAAGPEVRWLRDELDRLEGRAEPAAGGERERFDEGLRDRVAAFQKSAGLEADGRVGKQTLIRITALAADSGAPALSARAGGSSVPAPK